MKRKENLTLVYQTLLRHQVFGNVDTGWFVVAAKAPWDQLCSHTHCSESPLQLQCCNFRGSPLMFVLGPANTRREQVPLNEEGNTVNVPSISTRRNVDGGAGLGKTLGQAGQSPAANQVRLLQLWVTIRYQLLHHYVGRDLKSSCPNTNPALPVLMLIWTLLYG